MTQEESAIFEKTSKICLQTQILIEALWKDLAALRARVVQAQVYNEAAALYLERAILDAASGWDTRLDCMPGSYFDAL
jgi:hypothetical protein